MVAIKKYENSEYTFEFSKYIEMLFLKWLQLSATKNMDTAFLITLIASQTKENYRISYLKFLLPYLSEKHLQFFKSNESETLYTSAKIIHSMLINEVHYNDNNVNRLAEILLELTEIPNSLLIRYPLHDDFIDIQKLIWTFIVQFKKIRNLPIVSDGRIEIY